MHYNERQTPPARGEQVNIHTDAFRSMLAELADGVIYSPGEVAAITADEYLYARGMNFDAIEIFAMKGLKDADRSAIAEIINRGRLDTTVEDVEQCIVLSCQMRSEWYRAAVARMEEQSKDLIARAEAFIGPI
jgi:hypothetical protein